MKAAKILIPLLLLSFFSQCTKMDTETPGNLVPLTADQDPDLPQLEVMVAHHNRALHLQTFGNPANPPVFIIPGGPGADFRLLLPLKALADSIALATVAKLRTLAPELQRRYMGETYKRTCPP